MRKALNSIKIVDITTRLDEVRASTSPKSAIKELAEDLKKMSLKDKKEALVILKQSISQDIKNINNLSDLPLFHFGTIGKSLSESWIYLTRINDKAIKIIGLELDDLFKEKAQKILDTELYAITHTDEMINHTNLSACEYEGAIVKLLLFHKQNITKAKSVDEIWRIINELVSIQQAFILQLTSPVFIRDYNHIHEEFGGMKHVHIFDSCLARLISEKLDRLYEKDFKRCKTKEDKIRTFYNYPIIKHRIKSFSERFNIIVQE